METTEHASSSKREVKVIAGKRPGTDDAPTATANEVSRRRDKLNRVRICIPEAEWLTQAVQALGSELQAGLTFVRGTTQKAVCGEELTLRLVLPKSF
jgi:hypothetical protein